MNFVLVLALFLTFCFDSISSQGFLPSGCQKAFRNAALIAHNNLRARHGSSPLQANANIDASALDWSNKMAASGSFIHSGTLGENILFFETSISRRSQCAG